VDATSSPGGALPGAELHPDVTLAGMGVKIAERLIDNPFQDDIDKGVSLVVEIYLLIKGL